MKPRIDVISGFLGAGKTTLILEMIGKVPPGEKIAVCENEYGEAGIDGDTLRDQGLEVVDINAGCICCTLSINLIAGIKLIAARFRPTRIILEPTGLASLPDILNILRDEGVRSVAAVGTPAAVLDGGAMLANFERFQAYFKSQIAAASVVFLNRTEKMSEEERRELAALIESFNPNARVVEEPYEAGDIWAALDAPAEASPGASRPSRFWKKDFNQVSVQTRWPGSKERLEEFLPGLQRAGDIIRAKGYVSDCSGGRFRVDLSGGLWSYRSAGSSGSDMLQFIGRNLDTEVIKGFFKAPQ